MVARRLDDLLIEIGGLLQDMAVSERRDAVRRIKNIVARSLGKTEPLDGLLWVPREKVVANFWNPNSQSPDKLELLRTSIVDNGFCFPIVTIYDPDRDVYVIIDGFHRRLMCEPEWLDIQEVPIVALEHTMAQRMAATIQFNKARGIHQVDLDADVVRALIEQGLTEEQIAEKLGMELDSVHRYKQLTGVAALFAKSDYSLAWEMVEDDAP